MSHNNPTVIGITGHDRAGKGTLAAELEHAARNAGLYTQRVSMADPLRAILYATDPNLAPTSPASPLTRLQAVIDAHGWDGVKNTPYGPEVRRLLRYLATEGIRSACPSFFVDRAAETIAGSGADLIIIDDVRFPNEAELVESYPRHVTVRVARDNVRGTGHTHTSETAADGIFTDVSLTNDGHSPILNGQVGVATLKTAVLTANRNRNGA